jgi:hypothetical protein
LIQQRLPAVIAMQREITDDAAIAFAGGFYRAVARGYQIEAALAEARMAVYAQHNQVEWGIPALFSHAPDGCLFEVGPAGARAAIAQVGARPPGEPYTRSSYINRPAEERDAFDYLSTPGQPAIIWGPARFGKTWLLRYLLEHLSEPKGQCGLHPELCGETCEIVRFDLNSIDRDAHTSSELLLRELARQIARPIAKAAGADVEDWIATAWRQPGDPIVKMKKLFEELILPQIAGLLILTIDRADKIMRWSAQADFFYLLRVMAEASADDERWSRLRLLLTASIVPSHLSPDIHRSPFNLAPPIQLMEFDRVQVSKLAHLYRPDWAEGTDIHSLMDWVGGHPYLIRLAMSKSARHGVPFQRLIEEGNLHSGIFAEHLSEILSWIHDNHLEEAVKSVLEFPSRRLDRQQEDLLRRAGLVEREYNSYRLRCKLYENYLKNELRTS